MPIAAQGGLARRMSSHLALALILFCLFQIVIAARLGGPLILHLVDIAAIGGLALAARMVERSWDMLDMEHMPEEALELRYRRDVALIWLASVGGGLLWAAAAVTLHHLFD